MTEPQTAIRPRAAVARGRALTLAQIRAAVHGYLDFATRRALPQAPTAALNNPAAVSDVLAGLAAQGLVVEHRSGHQPVFAIAPDAHLAAAYYRNTIAHYFLPGAIAELALLHAAEQPPAGRAPAFVDEALALRGLLEFDFFFREREAFVAALEDEAGRLAADWRERLADGPGGVRALLESAPTLGSDMLLRPFFEAYAIVAAALAAHSPAAAPERAVLLEECLGLGRQYVLQQRLAHPEAVSRHLFTTGIDLALHRGLGEPGPEVAARREAFAGTLRDVLHRLAVVHEIAVRRVQAAVAAAAAGQARTGD